MYCYHLYMRILIIEDEEILAELIKKSLESEGYAADYLTDGVSGQSRIESSHKDYDLIIIDLMLPQKSGSEVCYDVRKMGITTPILILTAKVGVESKVSLLDTGADDYMQKPFELSELFARIRALTRRPSAVIPNELRVGNLTLSSSTKQVFKNKKEINLTLKEFRLLEYLMRHPNKVIERVDLSDNIWDFDFDSLSNIIDVYINRLRDKLDKDRKRNLIETVRGVGYKLKV
jgi:DNA-binding response OmpR family regulator